MGFDSLVDDAPRRAEGNDPEETENEGEFYPKAPKPVFLAKKKEHAVVINDCPNASFEKRR